MNIFTDNPDFYPTPKEERPYWNHQQAKATL